VGQWAHRKGVRTAKTQDEHGAWHEFGIEETAMTLHSLPYDVSMFRVAGGADVGTPAQLRADTPAAGEAVFGIGFVWDPDKKGTPDQKQLTIGAVADDNASGGSFCQYTNEDDVAVIENWRLEPAGCAGTDYAKFKYHAREERDPLLTRTAMTFGMSGSPLFDKNGRLIGIGSNVLSSTPLTFDPNKFAVYVKAANISKVLAELH
jgi:hypothetical protein